jgi:phosphoribosyl 1,2-cyclic phosphodiesterase
MSLFITSLNSGSNGNCYYIGNGSEAVLIDAGISCREIEKRMRRLQLDIQHVKAIMVSHEHGDHITGIPAISKKYRIPVYITQPTLRSSAIPVEQDLVYSFTPYRPVAIGNLSVTAFPKFHDAIDPHSFIVEGNGVRIGVFTDIGSSCDHVTRNFKQCHAVFLESNYCDNMLQNGNYPYYLKQRIRGGHGHLSNTQALELFNKHKGNHLSHLILSHLSKNNNSPELVDELFNRHAGSVKIVVASRYKETELFCVNNNGYIVNTTMTAPVKITQLSLF